MMMKLSPGRLLLVLWLLALLCTLGCGADREVYDAGLEDAEARMDAAAETDSSILDAAADTTRDALIAEDAGDSGAIGEASPAGNWLLSVDGGYWIRELRYEVSGAEGGGAVLISHRRLDFNGALSRCTQIEEATATWTVRDGIFDVVVTGGRTRRRPTNVGDDCGIGEDRSYDERDMTEEELGRLDFANGPFTVDGDQLTTTTFFSNGSENHWYWSREP